MRSGTFLYEIRFPATFILSFFLMGCVLLASAFYVHIGTTEAMLTAMTSLYVAPCESGPPVFLITLPFRYVFLISVALSLLPTYALSFSLFGGGLGICCLRSRNISITNLASGDHSAVNGTHAFVLWKGRSGRCTLANLKYRGLVCLK